ncbi:urease accessory protein UreD [Streptomyces sp. B-S-A8]|uniref:Urease accessory protein UreD n=1 Tax=Streptomyces solicavernae TaxID=3043614 RepID=A0ABT6RX46_9ACTN|nr:urease accessory protein UreD [Streptomyces sp. B-S-A8]MDI3389011.1 urease accessory protein UreD [Streptomyces sp. B-S-A8]
MGPRTPHRARPLMRARAELAVALTAGSGGRGRSRVARLRSDGPLLLRPAIATGPEPLRRWSLAGQNTARISRAAGAGGPLGGDDLRFHVEVGADAALVLRDVSATLALPGPHGEPSRIRTTVRVGRNATLVWLPEPVIAARGCDHHSSTRVVLEPGARLLLREELLLGRYGEHPGTVRQRLRVCQGDRPLYDQELAVGPGTPGWQGPAVTGGRRALGSLLVVDPRWSAEHDGPPAVTARPDTAVLPLSGPAVLVTALAEDAIGLRRRLDDGAAELEQTAAAPAR